VISSYFKDIKSIIESYSHLIADYSLNEKTYSVEKGFIEGKVSFIDDSILEFAEVKNIEVKSKLKYRYHYMETNNNTIFRYDNAKHFPDLKSFPHHKHLKDKTIDSKEPDINKILTEIERLLLKGK